MLLGIPKGAFYYDYIDFIKALIKNTDIVLQKPIDNNEKILKVGAMHTADEACLPIKLLAGQTIELCKTCDIVMLPRLMKNINGDWFCPEILGTPELVNTRYEGNKVIVTEPLFFDKKHKLRKAMWKVFSQLGIDRTTFDMNFKSAYVSESNRLCITIENKTALGANLFGSVLLIGHSYNVYDKWINKNIVKKLNNYGYDAITENNVTEKCYQNERHRTDFMIKPFWEAFERLNFCVRNIGSEVDGIIYLSSFSCGLDSVIIDVLKSQINDIPFMVMKLDEHSGEVGIDTRLEAFVDVMNRRKSYEYNIS